MISDVFIAARLSDAMAGLLRAELTLLKCALLSLFLGVCLCQRDCTGVDCPVLDNCIEEVLERGTCCASCVQKGCTCEGYQYYDCLSAGFKHGKVPEGDSYFVDYGSTECSCPAGGGRISCHFISCPDLPPNCIDVSEPADGCVQCERVGCVHDGEKYEAGSTFHIDLCQVCHCPNEGGKLMCYPVPDCDPHKTQKLMLAKSTEEDAGYRFDQQDHEDLQPSANLPLFKSPLLGKEELEDYDYGPTDFPDSYLQSLVFPTQDSPSSEATFVSRGSDGSDRTSTRHSVDSGAKLELRERFGVHENPTDRVEVTETPTATERESTVRSDFTSWRRSSSEGEAKAQSVSVSSVSLNSELENPMNASRSSDSDVFPLHQDLGSDDETIPVQIYSHHPARDTKNQSNDQRSLNRVNFPLYMRENLENPIHPQERSQTQSQGRRTTDSDEGLEEEEVKEEDEEGLESFQNSAGLEGTDEPYDVTSSQQESSESGSVGEKTTTVEPSTTSQVPDGAGGREHQTAPAVLLSTTSPPSARVAQDESQTLFNLRVEDQKTAKEETTEEEEEEERRDRPVEVVNSNGGPRVSAGDEVQSCCAAGQKWAEENQNCDFVPIHRGDKQSTCSFAQRQCCLSSVRESRCVSGVTSARGGRVCDDVDDEDRCADDSYQVCCSCCALGLRVRGEGRGCDAHQYLGYLCGQIFLTCCEEEGGPSQFPLRRKQKPIPTVTPRKVSDSKFPNEAFSIGASDEAANALEEREDVDECQLHTGQLCQHTCTNIWGSYRCGCHRGYVLQPDAHSCAPVSPEEENGVGEEEIPATQPSAPSAPSLTSTTAHLSPCAENGPCSQQCTAEGSQTRCSCFPGFSLMADGRTCEDADECSTGTHGCRPGERCVNTVGSFMCELRVTCPAGRQLKNGVCEDVDECTAQTHSCGVGFECENTVGSFLCRPTQKCLSGFTQDSHGNCVDINECSSLSELCISGFNCINTVGSFTCQRKIITCSSGYHADADGAKCVDVDECQMGNHRCGVEQICQNLPGSYRCDCQTGYQYDALRQVCTDVNECWRFPGRLCAQTCENTAGSYRCSCTAGFSLAFDGKNCEDVNECDTNPCGQECANIHGSYQCYCRQGFYLKEDGRTCEDIDECAQSVGNLCAFQCVNVAGSFQCACPPRGYVLSSNGRTCKDIDECSAHTHDCSQGQTCYNIQGSFRCLSLQCPHNYRKVSDTRCERLSCPAGVGSSDCQNSPVRITYYQLSFQTNIIIPAQIFRIGPSPAYAGDHVIIGVTKGNEEGYFSTRKLNGFTGAVYLQRQVHEPKDFLIDVEMKLLRQGTISTFLARIYVFITSSSVM